MRPILSTANCHAFRLSSADRGCAGPFFSSEVSNTRSRIPLTAASDCLGGRRELAEWLARVAKVAAPLVMEHRVRSQSYSEVRGQAAGGWCANAWPCTY